MSCEGDFNSGSHQPDQQESGAIGAEFVLASDGHGNRLHMQRMNFFPGGHMGWVVEHDRLIRRYLADHAREWQNLTGIRRLFARLRAARRAWKYAGRNHFKWGRNDGGNLY